MTGIEKLIKILESAESAIYWSSEDKNFIEKIADHLLANDVVPVVRCKDCKHWSDGVAGCTDHVKCCKIGFYMVGENGYCVYGEKKP